MHRQISRLFFLIAVSTVALCCKKGEAKKDAELEVNLDNRMNYIIQMYGSKEKLEKAAGKSYNELREEYRPVIAEQLAIEHAKANNSK